MPVTVHIPTPLRKYTDGQESVQVDGASIREMMDALEGSHAGVREKICDDAGNVRKFVNIFVNGEDIRFASNLDTELKDGDDVTIVPAIAGGVAAAAGRGVVRV